MITKAQVERSAGTRPILGVNVAVSSYDRTVENCVRWGEERQSRALFFANVHVIMEAFDDPTFRQRLNNADMVNPDGMPLVWALRALGEVDAERVYGPDATLAVLAAAEEADLSVGFYGASPAALDSLTRAARLRYPSLKIVFSESPPFRALTPEEDKAVVDRMAASKLQLLFVGLGCPKQEVWITDHLGKVAAVMLGVGAAFDFLAGTRPQAPRWMMRNGLEWVFRLASEPQRLAKRYFKHNPRFIGLILMQLLVGSAEYEDTGWSV
jgi:N-acetylglucosaminyldiphosphoundecaprenol N-acetyl-beta-D-mannosaminyltransferase